MHPYEDAGYSGLGGALYDSRGRALAFFSEELDKEFLDLVKEKDQSNVIQEMEMLALLAFLISPEIWCPVWHGHRAVAFTDSEAVRCSFPQTWFHNNPSKKVNCVLCGLNECRASRIPSTSCRGAEWPIGWVSKTRQLITESSGITPSIGWGKHATCVNHRPIPTHEKICTAALSTGHVKGWTVNTHDHMHTAATGTHAFPSESGSLLRSTRDMGKGKLELQTFNHHCSDKTARKIVHVTAIAAHSALPEATVNEMYDVQKPSIDHPILSGDALCVCEAWKQSFVSSFGTGSNYKLLLAIGLLYMQCEQQTEIDQSEVFLSTISEGIYVLQLPIFDSSVSSPNANPHLPIPIQHRNPTNYRPQHSSPDDVKVRKLSRSQWTCGQTIQHSGRDHSIEGFQPHFQGHMSVEQRSSMLMKFHPSHLNTMCYINGSPCLQIAWHFFT